MKTRIITSLAVGLMSVSMMLLGGSPASAGNGNPAKGSGHSQQAAQGWGDAGGSAHEPGCCTTFVLNNNSSLLSNNNVLSNIQVILNLLGLIGNADNGAGGNNGGGGGGNN